MGNSTSHLARRQYLAEGMLRKTEGSLVRENVPEIANGGDKEVLIKLSNRGLDNDEQKDVDFGSVLDKLGGAITGRALPNEEERFQGSYRHRPAEPSARLKLPAVRALLRELGKLNQQGCVSVEVLEQLARNYVVDQETLLRVLKYNRLPRPHTDPPA